MAEAEGATDDWSPGIRRSLARSLAMMNGLTEVPREWMTIAAKWRSPMYLSRAAQADAGAKTIGSIPWLADTEVGLEILGLDAQQVQRAMAERRRLRGSGVLESLRASAQQVAAERVATDGDGN